MFKLEIYSENENLLLTLMPSMRFSKKEDALKFIQRGMKIELREGGLICFTCGNVSEIIKEDKINQYCMRVKDDQKNCTYHIDLTLSECMDIWQEKQGDIPYLFDLTGYKIIE